MDIMPSNVYTKMYSFFHDPSIERGVVGWEIPLFQFGHGLQNMSGFYSQTP